MTKVIKDACDPEAARKLKEAYDLERRVAIMQHSNTINKLQSATSEIAKEYGGKAFKLIYGNNASIDKIKVSTEWMPEERVAVSTGFVQSFSCIPPNHVQAFWTYHLLNKV